jgi:chitinase
MTTKNQSNHTITAYVYDKAFNGMSDIDVSRLTGVNYSFALIKEGRADISHWQNEQKLRDLMKRHPELPVNLSIGGWKADGFSEAVATEAGRTALVDSLCELVDRFGFAGVDLDWEYPASSIAGISSAPEDVTNFPLFVNQLRATMKPGSRLTMAVGASWQCVEGIRYQDMAEAVDQINVMSYDMAPWGQAVPTAHHTALYPSVTPDTANEGVSTGEAAEKDQSVVAECKCGQLAIEAYAKAGVPLSKLVLGAAFYGRFHIGVERGATNGLRQLHQSEMPLTIQYRDICARLKQTGERFWDDEAKAPYLYDSADRLFATYEDPESLYWKTRYVKEKGLGGVMFWEYLGEDTAELLAALHKGMTTQG